jgi:glutamyl-tRNA synthetase
LFARRYGGTFVLRIEDTDAERSSTDMVTGILDGLRWLGVDWDEGPGVGGPHGPYFQSERLDRYRAMAERLVAGRQAYYCYCSPESLQQKRAAAEAAGGAWRYDRTCLGLSTEQVAAFEAAGRPRAVRFRVPDEDTRFDDIVHGPIGFRGDVLEDFVILRSDGYPTYHLSVVVDDVEMEISHVIRGDDHISNTPKHILLFRAFGAPVPAFAHVPLILGTDKKRLSKRHGATSVLEYERLGYLPEAMMNFLALLGWSPGTDREVFTRAELIEQFSLEGISGGNAVFNPDKLDWFNQQHLNRLAADEILSRIEPELREAGLWRDALGSSRKDWMRAVIDLVKPRARKLAEVVRNARPFLLDRIDYDPAAVAKHLDKPEIAPLLATLAGRFALLSSFDAAAIEASLRDVASEAGIKAALLIHATRVAVVGEAVSPGLFEVLALLGRERTISRLRAAGDPRGRSDS